MRITVPSCAILMAISAVDAHHQSLNAHVRAVSQANSGHTYHPYPAHLLRDHEVRLGGGVAAPTAFAEGADSHGVHSYHLRDSESFYWGSDGFPMTNFTAYAPGSDLKILSLERHRDVLRSAECSSHSIALMFHSDQQFDEVKRAWSWVNDDDAYRIMLVTENSDCNVPDGDPTIRQPWEVSTIKFDQTTGLVTLAAEPRTWGEAFKDQWRLQGGSRPIVADAVRMPASLMKRFTISGRPKVRLDHNADGFGIDVPELPISLACDPCHTTGELDFQFDVVPYLFPPRLGGTFEVYGDHIAAEIAAKLTAKDILVKRAWNQVIYDVPLPEAGLTIPGLLTLGFNLKLELAGLVSVDAPASVTAGVSVKIPDSSVYVLDFDDSSKDQNSGWQPEVIPILDLQDDVGVSASIGPQLVLSLDATVASFGGSIGLALAGPSLQAEAKVINDINGVCENPDAKTGVEVDMNIHVDLHAFESANLIIVKPAATQTFVAADLPVISTCIPHVEATPSAASLGNSSVNAALTTANNATSTAWVTQTAWVTAFGPM